MFSRKDNEFIAWYPARLQDGAPDDLLSKRSAAFYVHIPFCTAICDYCGFSVETAKHASIDRYLTCLDRELTLYEQSGLLTSRRFNCGHFGGGTPSVLSPFQFERLAARALSAFSVSEGAEITIEVNPISFNDEKSRAYQQNGVNRLSIGIQSFDDELLKVIGRPHKSQDVKESLDVIARGGWHNFSLDLMYGIPGQTTSKLKRDLKMAIATGAVHISCFRLEIIPFTRLKLREGANMLPKRLDEEELNIFDEIVEETLEAAGYRHYGVFNFSRPGFECLHNFIAFGAPQREYVGIGNSAYSFFNDHVYCNETTLPNYIEKIEDGRLPISNSRYVCAAEQMRRYFILGFKMQNVSQADFVRIFGIDPMIFFEREIDTLITNKYIFINDGKIILTKLGRRYINNVSKLFYSEDNSSWPQHLYSFVPKISQKDVHLYKKRSQQASKQ